MAASRLKILVRLMSGWDTSFVPLQINVMMRAIDVLWLFFLTNQKRKKKRVNT